MAKAKRLSRLNRLFGEIKQLHLVAILTVLISVISLLDEWHYWLELTSHFKWHYLIASIFFTVYYALRGQLVLCLVMTFTTVLNASFIVPWYLSSNSDTHKKALPVLKIIHANVQTANSNYIELSRFIERESPDIFTLQEVDDLWIEEISRLDQTYPYSIKAPRSDNFGIAVYSRIPFNDAKVIYLGKARVPSIKINVPLAGKAISLISTHPLPPINQDFFDKRNQQLQSLAEEIKNTDGPMILVGDLNVTMWSSDYRQLEQATRLTNSRYGKGVLATWPSKLSFVGIPIDHLLISSDFKVKQMRVGEHIGSDHRPIIVSLTLD
ncbi:hypothetical protein FLL45_15065 [Aliikangiella marina]|uniref:Endonuclease/exonuclease/phosphatase domain-containing protein n=1 Tax=Aliikangiella marina TaxID=1712262 RepID=A0A545T6C9_9GAMM|nr:endonuclease/exonuclease/phosphatase family protein [Aliikangiella marina]TQV72787.1 hypothetical protein FLL45_15065 [Aliikangiella marina]